MNQRLVNHIQATVTQTAEEVNAHSASQLLWGCIRGKISDSAASAIVLMPKRPTGSPLLNQVSGSMSSKPGLTLNRG